MYPYWTPGIGGTYQNRHSIFGTENAKKLSFCFFTAAQLCYMIPFLGRGGGKLVSRPVTAEKCNLPGDFVSHVRIMNTGYQTASLGNLFGLPYVVMRKPEPIDTTTLNYNWQVWETNVFSVYTKETDEIDERSAQEAVAAVLRYLSRVGLLRYNCHSGYLSSVVQESEMANVLTPAGGIFRRFVEPGQEVEYGQKLGVILDPFTAEIEAEVLCPTSGVVFFALKKPLTTEHEVAFKVIRRLHGALLGELNPHSFGNNKKAPHVSV